MLYCVRRWRFSDLKRLPSSRQTRYSGVIDFFTDTAGLAGSSGVSGRPLDTRISAAWTWLIRFGISEAWVGLLLRYADTILAASSTGVLPPESAIAQPFGIANASVGHTVPTVSSRAYTSAESHTT